MLAYTKTCRCSTQASPQRGASRSRARTPAQRLGSEGQGPRPEDSYRHRQRPQRFPRPSFGNDQQRPRARMHRRPAGAQHEQVPQRAQSSSRARTPAQKLGSISPSWTKGGSNSAASSNTRRPGPAVSCSQYRRIIPVAPARAADMCRRKTGRLKPGSCVSRADIQTMPTSWAQ
jgi:hypothetical protein